MSSGEIRAPICRAVPEGHKWGTVSLWPDATELRALARRALGQILEISLVLAGLMQS